MTEEARLRLDRLCRFVTANRLAALIVSLIIASAFGLGIPRIQSQIFLHELFPLGHPYLQLQRTFSEVFGGGSTGVVIALKARDGDIFTPSILTKLQQMNNEVEFWDEAYRSLTVSIANRSMKVVSARSMGEISIEPLMWPNIPKDDDAMELLKRKIFSNPAYNGTLVAKDGTAAILITEFKDDVPFDRIFERVRNLADRFTDEETSVHAVGFPMMMGWIYSLKDQILFVSAVSAGLMILMMLLIFRNFAGFMAPTCFGIICTAMGLGFIGWTGLNFSPLMYVLAFLVGARMVSHSVQITHRYFEEYARSNHDKRRACYGTMRVMVVPNWAGVATDAAGFLVLLSARILLMMQIAIFMSFWMLCIALCGILTPILCSYMPLGKAAEQWSQEKEKVSWMDRFCVAAAKYSIGSGRTVMAAVVIVLLVGSVWQASKLKIGDPTPGTPLLWPDHPYNLDQAYVDRTFNASSESFTLYYEGEPESVYQPVVANTFDRFDRHMKQTLPDIYKSSSSLANMMKMIAVMLHDGDLLYYQLSENRRVMMQYLSSVKGRLDRGALRRFLDYELTKMQNTLFFADHTSDNLLRIRQAAYDFFEDHPMEVENGRFLLAGGRVGMEIALNEEMKRAHVVIDSTVLLVIFVLCSFAFRSVVGGAMLTLPLILANLIAFAYMALMNIGLSINTLPVAAVGVGVGVDFAIYIYSRCKDEFPVCSGWEQTIIAAVRTSGKAVIYTGLTMVLPILTWYYLSDLKFQGQMGMFLAIIIGANVVMAITLHPLMISIIKPNFISRITQR